ncbi:MAG: SDR family oxidoreductase [Actinomycetota bacterium]|nr:SDR family oxidoreductase [Actinomycetota bacterium]
MMLVTGASGLLGSNLVLTAAERGLPLVATYGRRTTRLPCARNLALDLLDEEATRQLFDSVRPTWIVHCAAATDVDWCEANPDEAYRINAEVPRRLALIASELDARLAFISTDSVFDGQRGFYDESQEPSPVNVYAQTKVTAEAFVATGAPANLVIRTNFFGWSPAGRHGLAEWVVLRLESGLPVPAFFDVRFSPLLVTDLAHLVLDMIAAGLRGLYHVTASDSCTKYEFAIKLAQSLGLDPAGVRRSSVEAAGFPAERPRDTSLQTRKITGDLGKPMPLVGSGIERLRVQRDLGYRDVLRATIGE